MKNRIPTAAVLALMLLCLAAVGGARDRNRPSEAAPGEFDYYLLSLSWSPAFCLEKPGAAECSGTRRYGFIVHGLWPQNERGWPKNCSVQREVPDEVVQGISDIMPARGLVRHEWSTHGTCSGLNPLAFFALVRRAYSSVVIPTELARPTAATERSPSSIAAAFLRANPRLPAQSLSVTCTGQDAPRLRGVHICFDRHLAPRRCSADALRSACRAPQVIVPPIR